MTGDTWGLCFRYFAFGFIVGVLFGEVAGWFAGRGQQ